MSAYADKIAMEVIEADMRAGSRGLEHPPLEWRKAVALARAVSTPPPEAASIADTKRLDWLQAHNAGVYKSAEGNHWVVVDETARVRKGNLGKTLRDAVDDACRPQVER